MPRRPDATLVADAPTYRRLQFALLPRRMDAVVFLPVPVQVDSTFAFLANHEARTGQKLTLFQVLLAASARALHDRPHMNRFVKGGRLWQRDHVAITYSVKRSFEDSARIISTKTRFSPSDDLAAVHQRLTSDISTSRTSEKPASEQLMQRIFKGPYPVVRGLLGLIDWADHLGVLPASMVATSPLHTSAMVSNIGSLGLDGALHHLYESGTNSINLTLGEIRTTPVVDEAGELTVGRVATLAFAYDERICDGYYAAKTIEQLTHHVKHPGTLFHGG